MTTKTFKTVTGTYVQSGRNIGVRFDDDDYVFDQPAFEALMPIVQMAINLDLYSVGYEVGDIRFLLSKEEKLYEGDTPATS